MNIKENHYVIVFMGKDKPWLGRVLSVNDESKTLEVLPEKDVQYKQQSVTIRKKDARINLGMSPPPGKVYGCDTKDLFKKTKEHSSWGNIHYFTELEKSVSKMLNKSLGQTYEKLEKKGLSGFARLFETEIRVKSGKWAGMYIHSKKEDRPNRVWYAPECSQHDPKQMDYIVYHEFGHVVRFNGVLQTGLRNKWLRIYQRSIAPIKIEAEDLTALMKSISEYDNNEVTFKAAFDGSTTDLNPRVARAIIQWFWQTNKIGKKELEIMWAAKGPSEIEKFWPDHLIDTHDLSPVVSDYATKNVEELFAESFAFYMMGKKLPSKIVELLEESLSVAKGCV